MEERKPYLSEEQIGHYRMGAALAVADADVDHELVMNVADQGIRLTIAHYEPLVRQQQEQIEKLREALEQMKYERDGWQMMEHQACEAARELHGQLKETEDELRDERRRPH